jgi:hypothetical protein
LLCAAHGVGESDRKRYQLLTLMLLRCDGF